MRRIGLLALLSFITTSSFAQLNQNNPGINDPFNTKEGRALELANKWMNKQSRAVTDGTGRVTYPYGESLPSVICAPLKTCVIELQENEIITPSGLQIGDKIRWNIAPTVSGRGANKRTNLIIKPADVDLETTLTVATDKRMYQIKLLSHPTEWMPFVNFEYPEQRAFEWQQYHAAAKVEVEQNSLPDGNYVPELDFNYRVKGKTSFKPLRVYNDGNKTVIEMPLRVEKESLPTLLVVNGDQKELVNYRYKHSYVSEGRKINGRFIVDQLSKEIILISGVGSDQESILIKYKG